MASPVRVPLCPCGSGSEYAHCCGRFHAGAQPAQAVQLMRARYSAYVLRDEAYLQRTWHPQTRPLSAVLESGDGIKWLGLDVCSQSQHDDQATVEFVARYKLGGRARRLHEISHFVRIDGCWLYLDGGYSPAADA